MTTSRRAFTLMELLVAMTIIAILIGILIPTLSKARTLSIRATCTANLKSQGNAMGIYAQGNADALPVIYPAPPAPQTATGNWLHDQSLTFCDALMNTQAGFSADALAATSMRRWFYCPANKDQNARAQWDWNGGTPTSTAPALYRALGYAYFNDRGTLPATGATYQQLPARTPPLQYQKRFTTTPFPAVTELAIDEILSDSAATTSNFVAIFNFTNTSSHVAGKRPDGGNALCFDGHVAWRTFDPNNASKVPMSGVMPPYYWIPNP